MTFQFKMIKLCMIMFETYSAKKKYVSPLELIGFLYKLAVKLDLIFI